MKHYIRSYWTKYKQLYKKGLKGIVVFLAIGAIIFFVLATIASRGMGVIFNEVMARQTMMRVFIHSFNLRQEVPKPLVLKMKFNQKRGIVC